MESQMWRRVFLVLMVAGKGTLAAEGSNQEVYKKLCDITKGVKGLMKKENSEAKSTLHEALYGGNGRAHFSDDGRFTGYCGLSMHSRSQYCSHIQGAHLGLGGSDNHGCFGHSLLGTFLCTCVKGNNGDGDLCGLGRDVTDKGSWISGWISGNGNSHPQNLFKEVWKKIKQNCTENNTTVDLENLENSVKGIKNEAKQKNGNGYSLGGNPTTHGVCSGMSHGDACVTYPADGSGPKIPWADKVLSAIDTLYKSRTEKKKANSNTLTTGEGHHHRSTEDTSDEAPHSNDEEGDEESEEPEETPGPHNTSKPPRPKRKRRSASSPPTEQRPEPRKAILHKDDGSFLPQPFWLLSAVVF